MKKRLNLLITLVICVVIVYICFMTLSCNSGVAKLNKKISQLQDCLLSDLDINFTKEEYIVFISVTDSQQKAYVSNAKSDSLKKAIDIAKELMNNNILEYKIDPEWVKIDVVNEEDSITKLELKNELNANENSYRRGISLDTTYNVALLDSELNANQILDYEKKEINLNKLNNYLTSNNKKEEKLSQIPNEFITFSCVSYVYDNKEIYKLGTSTENYGRRQEKELDENKILEVMINTSEYLINCVKEDGKFIYSYNPISDNESNSYNILRHEGTTWSMIEVYNLTKNKKLKENIELAIKFVVNNSVKYKDDNTAYIIENKNNEIKLGANGIGILMFIEYMEVFNTDEYEDLVIKLGNGMLDMQNDDGSYYHVYRYPEFDKYEKYRTVYYDGEATFALAKLYGFTKDEKWLSAAENSLEYFYDNNYEKYKDHWIEYAINEVTKYNPKKEFLELGLKNIRDNLPKILNLSDCKPINLELLTTGLEIYDRAYKNEVYIDNFNVNDLINAIYDRADFQLNGLFYPEIAMYFNNPERILNSFYTRETSFRVRIDDVQHNINGYYNMYKNYRLIQKYKGQSPNGHFDHLGTVLYIHN